MTGTVLLPAVVAGLAVGSFLNVCIHRIPRGESIAHPPSRCPGCGHGIRWFENVPVVSWVALRARCSHCGIHIPAMYPIVELLTGAVFAGGVLLYGVTPLAAVRIVFACAMIVLFVIDLQHQLLPNVITVPGIVLGLGWSAVGPPGWQSSLLGVAVGGGLLWAIAEGYYRWRGEEGMGMGDVKMLGMIGAFLGWPLVILTLVLASFLGSLVGVGLLATRRGDMKSALPFGTFLAIAALVAAAVGDDVVAWYVARAFPQ